MDKLTAGHFSSNADTNKSPTIINAASIVGPDDYALNTMIDIVNMPNFTKPDEPHKIRSGINYDVQIGVFYCAICGEDIPWFEGQNPNKARVCNECKQAIAWAKEKMKEKEDGRIST